MSVADQKTVHGLHTCRDPQEFVAAFAATAGEDIAAFVGRFVASDRVAACLLVGSIPLRIGTGASDVDIVVLVDGRDAVRIEDGARHDDRIVFSGRFGDEDDTLVLAEVIGVLGGVETDVEFISLERLGELASRVSRAGTALTPQEIRILSRIKTGWRLFGRERPQDAYAALLRDNSLEKHCVVSNLTIALQDLEDARVALSDHLPLALYLGRSAVERCFAAYFAGRGYAYLGTKWLRFLKQRADGGRGAGDEERDLTAAGLPLLFPAFDAHEAQAAAYLKQVAGFVVRTRAAIETDRAFKVALRMCPQIYDPVAAAG